MSMRCTPKGNVKGPRYRWMSRRAGSLCLAGLFVGLGACAGGQPRQPVAGDEPRRVNSGEPRRDEAAEAERQRRLSLDDARKKAEAEYQSYLNERREQERRREASRRDEEDRRRAERAEADANERRTEEAKREQERRDQQDRAVREARAARNADDYELRESERDVAIYVRNLESWKIAAAQASLSDMEEDALAAKEAADLRMRAESEARSRRERLDRVDTDQKRFYRLESEARFPRRLEVAEAATRQVRLFKNRNPLQFMAYSDGNRRSEVTPVALPTSETPLRFHLYDFLKGRPGNYVLLDAHGAPVLIAHSGIQYRIVNIRSDGQALFLVDLESEDLGEYHRVSVDGIDLLME